MTDTLPHVIHDPPIQGNFDWFENHILGRTGNQEVRSPTVEGDVIRIHDGTDAEPATEPRPTVKITRVENVQIAEGEHVGLPSGAQASHLNPALSVVTKGAPTSQYQSTAAYFGATTQSTDANGLNDAGGIVSEARVHAGNGTCNGGTFLGRREEGADVEARATGIEVHVQNYGAAETWDGTGTSRAKGVYLVADGDENSASAIEVTSQGAMAFDIGIGFGRTGLGSSVISSTFYDQSLSDTSINIDGTHNTAIRIAAGAGLVNLGEGVNIRSGTTTGTKIGTATTQKLGFWNVAPVVQPAAYTVTHPTTDRGLDVTGDTTAQGLQVLGTLIADLQSIGLIG